MSQLAVVATLASLKRQDLVRERVATIAAEREKLKRACDALGVRYTPTQANFVWIDVRRSGKDVSDALLRHGFMVRSGEVHDAPGHIRVTIGRPDENDGFIEAFRAVLTEVAEPAAGAAVTRAR